MSTNSNGKTLVLVRQARAGSQDSGDALYDQVSPALSIWVRSRVARHFRGRLDSDDLTHEIWIRVLEVLPGFDPDKGAFRPWLFGVAKNVTQELLRKLSRVPLAAGDAENGGLLDRPKSDLLRLSEILQRNELLGLFWQRFQSFSERDQDLLVHMGLEGMTAKQTATLLGISVAATEKSWQRLRRKVESDPTLRKAIYFDEAA